MSLDRHFFRKQFERAMDNRPFSLEEASHALAGLLRACDWAKGGVSIDDLLIASKTSQISYPIPIFLMHCSEGNSPHHSIKSSDIISLMNQFRRAGGNINLENSSRNNPFHYASCYNDLDIFEYLIEHGADVNTRDRSGKSALHLALHSDSHALEFVAQLLNHPSFTHCDATDVHGHTALYDAISARTPNTALILKLIAHPVSLTPPENLNFGSYLNLLSDKHDPAIGLALLEAGAALHTPNQHGFAVLEQAALTGKVGMLQFFVKHCYPSQISLEDLDHAWDVASRESQLECAQYLVDITLSLREQEALEQTISSVSSKSSQAADSSESMALPSPHRAKSL